MQDIQIRQYPQQLFFRASQVALQVLFFLFLVRSLSPDEFGTIAIVTLILSVSYLLADLGLEQAIAQQTLQGERSLSSAFWLSTAAALFLTLLIEAVSQFLGDFFSIPLLHPVLRLCALAVALTSLIVFSRGLLLQRKQFRRLAFAELLSTGASFLVGIALLASGNGLNAFVAFVLCQASCRALFLSLSVRWIPSVVFDRVKLREIRITGRDLQTFALLNFGGKSLDTLIVGKFLGVFQLGLYNFSYRVIPFLQDVVLGPMRQMVLPLYAEHASDREKLYQLLCRDTNALTALSLPLMAFIAVHGTWIVPEMIGENWSATVPILTIFSLEAGRQVLGGLASSAIIAVRRSDLIRQYGLWSFPVLLAAFLVGIPWGAFGVAFSYFVFNSILNIYLVLLLQKALRISLFPLCIQWIPGAAVSLVIVGFSIFFNLFLSGSFSGVLVALISAVVGLWWIKVAFPATWNLLKTMAVSLRLGSLRTRRARRCIVYLDPLMNEKNPHLSILHRGLQERGEADIRELRFTTFVIQLPWKRLTEFLPRRVILHFHFINRFYESRSAVMAALKFTKLIGAVVWCRIFGVRIVWTIHDEAAHDFDHRRMEKFFLFWFIQCCDQIVTLSERGKEILWERYGRTHAVTFTPHPPYTGVYPNSITRSQARRRLRISPNDHLYVFVGRLMPYKGLEDLIKSFQSWRPLAKVKLAILGAARPAGYESTLLTLAKSDSRITIVPEFLSDEDVSVYLKAADFGVLPYRQILHSGTTMMFATFECPVIVPNKGWFPEILRDYEIGIMYDSTKPGGLGEALSRSAQIPRERYRKDMRRLCSAWSLERAVELTSRVYEGVE